MASNINDLKKNKNKYSIDEYKQKLSKLKIPELKELAKKEKIIGFSKYKIKVCLQDFILAKVKKIPLSKECWDKYGGTDDLKPKSSPSKKPKSSPAKKPKPKSQKKAKPVKASKAPKDCNPEYINGLLNLGITKLKKDECPKFFGAKNASKETINSYLGQSCSSLTGKDKKKLINAMTKYCKDQDNDDNSASIFQSPEQSYQPFIPSDTNYNEEVKQLFDYYKSDKPDQLYSEIQKPDSISPVPFPILTPNSPLQLSNYKYIYVHDGEDVYKIENFDSGNHVYIYDWNANIYINIGSLYQEILSPDNYRLAVYVSNNSSSFINDIMDEVEPKDSLRVIGEDQMKDLLTPYIKKASPIVPLSPKASPTPIVVPLSQTPSQSLIDGSQTSLQLKELGSGKNTYLLFIDNDGYKNYHIYKTDDQIETTNIEYDGFQKLEDKMYHLRA